MKYPLDEFLGEMGNRRGEIRLVTTPSEFVLAYIESGKCLFNQSYDDPPGKYEFKQFVFEVLKAWARKDAEK